MCVFKCVCIPLWEDPFVCSPLCVCVCVCVCACVRACVRARARIFACHVCIHAHVLECKCWCLKFYCVYQSDGVRANSSPLLVRIILGHRNPRCLRYSEQRICCRVVGNRSALLNQLLKIFNTNLSGESSSLQLSPSDAGTFMWLCEGSDTASKAKFRLSKDTSSVIVVDWRQYCSDRSFVTSAAVSVGRCIVDISLCSTVKPCTSKRQESLKNDLIRPFP